MTKSKEPKLKDRLAGMDLKKKVTMGAVGVAALAGLGFGAAGAANAATPAPAPHSSSSGTTSDILTPGDTPDIPGAKDAQDTADVSGVNDAPDQAEKAGAPETADDAGAGVQQTGDHTEPGDAPDSP